MSLENEDLRHLEAAQGFVTLGLHLEANAELERIDAYVRHVPEVLRVRLAIYRALEKWELMQTVAKRLALYDPDDVEATRAWAFATRRAECIEAARLILREAVERLPLS